jgi:hypothetical protein
MRNTAAPVSIFPNGDNQLLTTITANVLLRFWKKGEFVISPEMQLGKGIGNGKGAYQFTLQTKPSACITHSICSKKIKCVPL